MQQRVCLQQCLVDMWAVGYNRNNRLMKLLMSLAVKLIHIHTALWHHHTLNNNVFLSKHLICSCDSLGSFKSGDRLLQICGAEVENVLSPKELNL